MSPCGKPLKCRSKSCIPRRGIVGPSRRADNLEFPALLPFPAAEDSTEVAVVRLVTFVQAQRAVVKEDPCRLRQERAFFQTAQDRGMKRWRPLDSFKGGRETGGFSKGFGMVKNNIHRGDGRVAGSRNPAADGMFQQTKLFANHPQALCRRDACSLQGRDKDFRKHSSGVKPFHSFPAIQAGIENQQQRITPPATRFIAARENETNRCITRLNDFFPHPESITAFTNSSNPF